MKIRVIVLSLLFCFIGMKFIQAQFPTKLGTKWEYSQFMDEYIMNQHTVVSAFQDSISHDTTINSISYKAILRSGHLRTWSGWPPTLEYDYLLDGEYFIREHNDTVFVIDTVIGSVNIEAILYDFSVSIGDPVDTTVLDLLTLTRKNTWYSLEYYCQQSGGCNGLSLEVDTGSTMFGDPGYITTEGGQFPIESFPRNVYRKDVGTLRSFPMSFVLDVWGQHYFLHKLSDPDTVLFVQDFVVTSIGNNLNVDEDLISIMPNPISDVLFYTFEKVPKHIVVYDVNGKEMLVIYDFKNVSAIHSINAEQFLPGIYYVSALFSEGMVTKKIIKF